MKYFLKKKVNWLFVIGVAAVILFVFSNYFFGKYQMSFTNLMYDRQPWDVLQVGTSGPYLSDVVDSFTPSMFTTIKDGSIFGFWDPQVALGAPADISSWMYPLNYLYLLPLGAAVMLRAISEFVIAFIGMYLMMRSFDCKKPVAAIAGISYCFSSVIVMWLGWQHSDVAAFAPLAFFLFEKFLTTIKIKYCFGLAAVVYLMLVAGMPTYAAYFMYLLAFYVLFRTAWLYRERKKRIFQIYGCTLASVAAAVLASLPYLVNLLSTVGSNGYADSRLGQSQQVLGSEFLQSLFMPYLRIRADVHMNESTIFVGLVALALLAFTAVHFRKKKRMIFWTAALAVVFLLIFTHVFDGIYGHMPLVNTSHKFRLITLLNFIMVVIAGINLNDIVINREDYQKHKLKTCLFGLAGMAILGAGFLWTYSVYDNQGHGKELAGYIVTVCCIGVILLAFFIKRLHSNIILAALTVVTAINMGSFAKNYLPWIEKDAEIIPPATDTIQYLQENTDDERIAAAGPWTLFPNTNIYYGLDDVRAHNFVMTNADMTEYYNRMTEDGFRTKTRFTIIDDVNENLLKYLGVKYQTYAKDTFWGEESFPLGPINRETSVSQTIAFPEDSPSAIVLNVATYQQEFGPDDICFVELRDSMTGEVVYSQECAMEDFEDNSPYMVKLQTDSLEGNREYTMTVYTNTPVEKSMTLYVCETEGEKQLYYNNQAYDYELVANYIYGDVFYGEDGLITEELDEFTERVELADSVVIGTEEEILEDMSGEFVKHTVFCTEEEAAKLSNESYEPLTDADYAEITERSDDSVTVEVHTESAKILMLNEYYDSHWSVYVNGEKQELLKSNYLFRSVEVPAGDSVVEFRYEPKLIYAMYAVSGITCVAVVILVVFYKRIQIKLDTDKKKNQR